MGLILNENFEGTGYENSWAESVDSGNTSDEDSAIPGTAPPGSGSQCHKAIATDAVSVNAFAYNGSANQNISYIRGYLYIGAEGLADGEVFSTLFLIDSSFANFSTIMQIGQNAGQLQIRLVYYSGGALQPTAWANINIQQWYRVEYKYDITNLKWEWKIDGAAKNSGSLVAATITPYFIGIGINGHEGSSPTTLYSDLITWNDSNWVAVPVIMRHRQQQRMS